MLVLHSVRLVACLWHGLFWRLLSLPHRHLDTLLQLICFFLSESYFRNICQGRSLNVSRINVRNRLPRSNFHTLLLRHHVIMLLPARRHVYPVHFAYVRFAVQRGGVGLR